MFDRIGTLLSLGSSVVAFSYLIWKGPRIIDQNVERRKMAKEKGAQIKRFIRPLFALGLVIILALLID